MQLKTILNRVQKHRSFVYGKAEFVESRHGPTIEIEIRPRANGRAVCSGCEQPRPGYDTLPARRFEFVPLWGILVFFLSPITSTIFAVKNWKTSKNPFLIHIIGFGMMMIGTVITVIAAVSEMEMQPPQ